MVICEEGTSFSLGAEQYGNGVRGLNVVGVGVGTIIYLGNHFFFQAKDAVIEQLMKNQEHNDLED